MKKVLPYVICVVALAAAAVAGLEIVKGSVPQVNQAVLGAPPRAYYPAYVATSADATGGVTIWATATEERFQIGSVFISASKDMTVTLLDGSLEIPVYAGIRGGACVSLDPGWQSQTRGNDLSFTTDTSGDVTVVISGESVWY